jgi:hypothetical protein
MAMVRGDDSYEAEAASILTAETMTRIRAYLEALAKGSE